MLSAMRPKLLIHLRPADRLSECRNTKSTASPSDHLCGSRLGSINKEALVLKCLLVIYSGIHSGSVICAVHTYLLGRLDILPMIGGKSYSSLPRDCGYRKTTESYTGLIIRSYYGYYLGNENSWTKKDAEHPSFARRENCHLSYVQ